MDQATTPRDFIEEIAVCAIRSAIRRAANTCESRSESLRASGQIIAANEADKCMRAVEAMTPPTDLTRARWDIYFDIAAERRAQDETLGSRAEVEEYDDRLNADDWRAVREIYEQRIIDAPQSIDGAQRARESLVKVAAIVVAQIESFDRDLGSLGRITETGPSEHAEVAANSIYVPQCNHAPHAGVAR
jgi:hypothetical protein